MDDRHFMPSVNVEDRRQSLAQLAQPSFRYAKPFAEHASSGRRDQFWQQAEQPATGLAGLIGLGDIDPLSQELMAQRAMDMLEARGRLPSYDWYNQVPRRTLDKLVDQ